MYLLLLLVSVATPSASGVVGCGGTLTAERGLLQTPNYPHEFQVPIKCEWVIEAQEYDDNTSIVVYMTQMFLFEGITFTEYSEYDRSFNIPGKVIHRVTEDNVTSTNFVLTFQKYLVVNLELDTLEGTHLRVLDHFLDVFGFNITYEITRKSQRSKSCKMSKCGFTGMCQDYSTTFGCECFDGYTGPTCSDGPKSLCHRDGVAFCQNGAKCVLVGTTAVSCRCKEGFVGDVCAERVAETPRQACDRCVISCPFDGNLKRACQCPAGLNTTFQRDRIAFSGTLRLSNLPKLNNDALQAFIENQIRITLKPNFAKAENLIVYSAKPSSTDTKVILHFYGAKKDEKRVKSILNKWAHRGYIGNITIPTKEISFSTLALQSLSITPGEHIREGGDFILTCGARGSSSMTFRWFKDGIFVNVSYAESKNKWVHSERNSTDQYMAFLGIDKAALLDDGVFTCQVEDHGIQQCLSKRVFVKKPPVVKMQPMSLTVTKGENFQIKCISLDGDVGQKYVYSWSKNGKLLPVRTESEKYLILYPGGSILQVSKIDKSTSYSCLVQGDSVRSEVGIRVNVIDGAAVRTCPGERYRNSSVLWPPTSPGTEDVEECPQGYTGVTRRSCTLLEADEPVWLLPDFSGCIHGALEEIDGKFQLLRLGYQATTSTETLSAYLSHLESEKRLLSGEGARILTFVRDVIGFINTNKDTSSRNNTVSLIFGIIDAVLRQRDSLMNQSQVILLQQVVKDASLLTAMLLLKPQSVLHRSFPTIDVNMAPADSSSTAVAAVPIPGNSYPDWFSYKLNLRVGVSWALKSLNYSFVTVVYRNLSSFLPARSIIRMKDGTEIEYELLSQIASVWLPESSTSTSVLLTMEFTHPPKNNTLEDWRVQCAVAEYAASHEYTWDTTACHTRPLEATSTRCSCEDVFGTFAVLVTNYPQNSSEESLPVREFVVLIGCASCLLLAVLTAVVLGIYWSIRRSCLVFLKLQCSLSVVGTMTVFIVAISCERSAALYTYTVTFLEVFLLISLASQLSKLLIVYTEIVHIPRPSGTKQTVIGIITGVPVITVFGNHLAHRSTDSRFVSWWLMRGTLSFSVFITCASVISILFLFLYMTVMKKLKGFVKLNAKCSKALEKRVGMLKRSTLLFFSILLVTASSILYVNTESNLFWQCEFCISSILLGVALVAVYILQSETSIRQHFVKGLSLKDENYFSSDLSFFTKQEPDVESESVPQQKREHFANGNKTRNEAYRLSETKSFLQEGIQPVSFSICESTSFSEKLAEATDIEKYNSSPKHFRYAQEPKGYQKSPDILSRKICPELDLVASSLRSVRSDVQEKESVLPSAPDEAIAKLLEDPSFHVKSKDEDENLDGMLDKISHDLDYLLNRSPDDSVPTISRRLSKPSLPTMLEEIVEENEEEVTTDIIRTAC